MLLNTRLIKRLLQRYTLMKEGKSQSGNERRWGGTETREEEKEREGEDNLEEGGSATRSYPYKVEGIENDGFI